jgi:hypothetical protein
MAIFPVLPFLPFLRKIGSDSFRRKIVEIFPWPAAHRLLGLYDIIKGTANDIYEEKKDALLSGEDRSEEQLAGGGKDLITPLSE